MNILNPLIDKLFLEDSSVIFLHAHPDDEAFLSAGLLNELSTRGRKCSVIFAAAAIVDGKEQTLIRQKEAEIACKLLGASSVHFLEFCEPKYREGKTLPLVDQSEERVSTSIFATLQKKNIPPPFIFISYDKNGGYGNLDHKVVHAAGLDFLEKHRALTQSFFETTINREAMLKWLDYAKKEVGEKFLPKLSYWTNKFGLSSTEITHYYQLTDAQLKLKRTTLAVHASQMATDEFPLSLSEDDFKTVFGYEFFKLVN